MNELSKQKCEACRADAPKVDVGDYSALLQQLPGWRVENIAQVPQLIKVFTFKNFVDALAFTNDVGGLAEEYDHHPALTTEWGRVTVRFWTHKIGGLHRNDFILAAKTDAIFSA
jgi:4a-hydroxytetrahydrobiopterin dehydratase